ncbi:hypothetical protein BDR04DRAFT_829720 [Suillus decipiens]|nr:hypothetical protein BDR04DRAFT_829720 [Suillus decipiens]
MLSSAQLVSYISLAHLNNYSYSICTHINLVLVLYLSYPVALTSNLVVFHYLVGRHSVGFLYLPTFLGLPC